MQGASRPRSGRYLSTIEMLRLLACAVGPRTIETPEKKRREEKRNSSQFVVVVLLVSACLSVCVDVRTHHKYVCSPLFSSWLFFTSCVCVCVYILIAPLQIKWTLLAKSRAEYQLTVLVQQSAEGFFSGAFSMAD